MIITNSLITKLTSVNFVTTHLFQVENSKNIYFIEINPMAISKISYISEESKLLKGENAYYGHWSGKWDKLTYPFESNLISLLTIDIFENKLSSSKTYSYIKHRYSKEKADLQVTKLEKYLNKFCNGKYLSQYELGHLHRNFRIGPYSPPRNELIVAINRKGEFIRLIGGRHRLAVSQVLKLEKIPAILTLTHPDAVNFLPKRHRIIKNNKEDFRPFS